MFGAGAAEMQAQNLPQRTAAEAIPVAQQRDEGQGILGDPGGMFRGVGTANPNDMAQHATNVATPMGAGIQTQPQEFMADAAEQGVPPGVTVQQAAGIAAANQNVPAGGTATNQTPQAAFDPPMAGGVETPMEDVPTVQMNPMAAFAGGDQTLRMIQVTEVPSRAKMILLAANRFLENPGILRDVRGRGPEVISRLKNAAEGINRQDVKNLFRTNEGTQLAALIKGELDRRTGDFGSWQASMDQINRLTAGVRPELSRGANMFASAYAALTSLSNTLNAQNVAGEIKRVRMDPEAEVAALRGFGGARSRASVTESVAGSTITALDPRSIGTRSSAASIRSIATADPSQVPDVFRRAAAEAARSDAPTPGLERAMEERVQRRSARQAEKRVNYNLLGRSAATGGSVAGSTLDRDGNDL
jgi:hypothetical protein